jgi:cytochrome c-type biogenesis protein CcmH
MLALLLTAVITNTAAAQSQTGQPVTDDEVNEIARGIFCPVCENTPLDVCPTQACADWREIIRTKLSQGQSEQQIKNYFVEQYGPRTLAEPPQEGFTRIVWIIPIITVVVGGFFFSRYLRGIQTAASTPTNAVQTSTKAAPREEPAQDDYVARIERELKERAK